MADQTWVFTSNFQTVFAGGWGIFEKNLKPCGSRVSSINSAAMLIRAWSSIADASA